MWAPFSFLNWNNFCMLTLIIFMGVEEFFNMNISFLKVKKKKTNSVIIVHLLNSYFSQKKWTIYKVIIPVNCTQNKFLFPVIFLFQKLIFAEIKANFEVYYFSAYNFLTFILVFEELWVLNEMEKQGFISRSEKVFFIQYRKKTKLWLKYC